MVEKALSLAKWEIFERLATDEVAMIAVKTGEVEYEAGEVIDPDGPTGSSMHMILRGSVQQSVDDEPFRRAGPNDAFGGTAVFGDPMPGEKLVVLEPTHALVLSREDFEQAVADQPEFALAVIRAMAEQIRRGGRTRAAIPGDEREA